MHNVWNVDICWKQKEKEEGIRYSIVSAILWFSRWGSHNFTSFWFWGTLHYNKLFSMFIIRTGARPGGHISRGQILEIVLFVGPCPCILKAHVHKKPDPLMNFIMTAVTALIAWERRPVWRSSKASRRASAGLCEVSTKVLRRPLRRSLNRKRLQANLVHRLF